MSTPLLRDFPELAHLTCVVIFSEQDLYADTCAHRREDLEELLVDPAYFQAIFHSLEQVKALYQAQAELGLANESIARQWHLFIQFTKIC